MKIAIPGLVLFALGFLSLAAAVRGDAGAPPCTATRQSNDSKVFRPGWHAPAAEVATPELQRVRQLCRTGWTNAQPDLKGRPDAPEFAEAERLLRNLMEQGNGASLQLHQEFAWLRHDQGYFGAAAAEWTKILRSFGDKPNFEDPKVKAAYFDGYFNYVYCKYRFAQAPWSKINAKARKDHTVGAAALILKLAEQRQDMGGDGFPRRYQDLLDREELLRSEHIRLRMERKPTPAG